MSKLKSAGSTLNIAENAKISESALKMTEYLRELNSGVYEMSYESIRLSSNFLPQWPDEGKAQIVICQMKT